VRRKVMGVSGKPHDDDGFAALTQLESPRKKASPHAADHPDGLRLGRHSSLLAKMPTPKPRKRLRPRGQAGKRLRPRGFIGRWNRVKGSASRGRWKKWVLIPVVVLLLIPAMQVAVVRFVNPPLTLPMLIEQGSATFSSAPTRP
jgi:hypothetical protein